MNQLAEAPNPAEIVLDAEMVADDQDEEHALKATDDMAIAAATGWRSAYAAYVDAKLSDRSPHTRRMYGRRVEDFFAWSKLPSLDGISPALLARYRAELAAAGKSAAVRSQAISAVRSFLNWCRALGAYGLPDGDVMRETFAVPPARVRRPYQVLTTNEATTIGNAINNSRDHALVALMLGAGLRRTEVAGLEVRDIAEGSSGATVVHVHGKGAKSRTVPLGTDVAGVIRAYLDNTGRTLGGPGRLFLAHDPAVRARGGSESLTAGAVAKIVRTLVKRAGIHAKAISAHSLRHTFAIRFLRAGGNVVALQKILGHADLKTTQHYLDHIDVEDLAEDMPALPWTALGA